MIVRVVSEFQNPDFLDCEGNSFEGNGWQAAESPKVSKH
jgi:hypothetical protein